MTGLPHPDDHAWLRRFRRAVVLHLDELTGLVEAELGKPAFETLMSDLLPLLSACRWHERYARRILRPRRLRGGGIAHLGQRHTLHRRPVGHIAIIATWNYPLQLLGVQLVQAILAGNRVTVKPSERTPQSQLRLLELARDAGLDESRLTWTSAEREAGERLLAEQAFDHVLFTGSTDVGRKIAAKLSETLTPSTLELSGADSALVLSGADVDLAAKSLVFAATLNGGSTCLVPRRVIVVETLADKLLGALGDELRQVPNLTGYRQADHAGVFRSATQAVADGGRWLDPAMSDESWSGLRVVIDPPVDSAFCRGEHFGPGLAILVTPTDESARQLHGRFPQRLVTALFCGRAASRGQELALGGSMVTLNDSVIPSAHPAAPLAGRGPSGWGISRGAEGLLALTRPVDICRTSRWLRPPTDLPSEAVQRRLRKVVSWWYR